MFYGLAIHSYYYSFSKSHLVYISEGFFFVCHFSYHKMLFYDFGFLNSCFQIFFGLVCYCFLISGLESLVHLFLLFSVNKRSLAVSLSLALSHECRCAMFLFCPKWSVIAPLIFSQTQAFLSRALSNFKLFGFVGLNFGHWFSILLYCGQKTGPVQFLLFGIWDSLCGLIYDQFS